MKIKAKIWIPAVFFECFKDGEHCDAFTTAMKTHGYDVNGQVAPKASVGCALTICGSFAFYDHVVQEQRRNPRQRVVHYNWDLYPFQINDRGEDGRLTVNGTKWNEYVELLKDCEEIWVPSKCTIDRTVEYTGRDAVVIKSAVFPWEEEPFDGGYVVDVMRKYTGEPNVDLTREVCEELGIKCVEMRHRFTWDEFKTTVAGARLLVSPYYEASTGGLTLLEGYCLGKHSLISDSPRQGGVDYLGGRASYFRWDDRQDFKNTLSDLFENPKHLNPGACRKWVEEEYGVEAFARRIADRLDIILEV